MPPTWAIPVATCTVNHVIEQTITVNPIPSNSIMANITHTVKFLIHHTPETQIRVTKIEQVSFWMIEAWSSCAGPKFPKLLFLILLDRFGGQEWHNSHTIAALASISVKSFMLRVAMPPLALIVNQSDAESRL